MLSVNENSVYVPAISKYVLYDNKSKGYFLSDSHLLSDVGGRKHLLLTKEAAAYTTRELSDSEKNELNEFKADIKTLKEELPNLKEQVRTQKLELESLVGVEARSKIEETIKVVVKRIALLEGTGLLAKQANEKVSKKIKDLENKIQKITTPEYFVFVAKSKQITALEEKVVELRKAINSTYKDLVDGAKDKSILASQYDSAKTAFLQARQQLNRAYDSADYLRTFTDKDGALEAKEMQSILHIGFIKDKSALLAKLLGSNVPKSPLKSSDLDQLKNVKALLELKRVEKGLTIDDRAAFLMLIGVELQHHLL